METCFLAAQCSLTKSFQNTGGTVSKTPYPFVKDFTSHIEVVFNMAEFEATLRAHALLGHCLLKGMTRRPLVSESRAGSTESTASTDWLVLDVDGANCTVGELLAVLGLHDVDHVVQYSASYGLSDKLLRAHIFMMLDTPIAAPMLKQWLIQQNHAHSLLRNDTKLTKTHTALSWVLDITACQNDKLLYIAPPIFKGMKDPCARTPRIGLNRRSKRTASLDLRTVDNGKNRELTDNRIHELRKAAGLPQRKLTTKLHGSVEVLVKADAAIVTGIKHERGFVYFNLNNGDSWAYYHPEDNPMYIHSFKGEPSCLTKELLPEYWGNINAAGMSTRNDSSGLMYLAFCDRESGVYWRGTFNAATQTLDIAAARTETQLRHFAKQYGVPLGDYIPEWTVMFDPMNPMRVDTQNKTVNRFQPTEYMRLHKPERRKQITPIPSTIRRVIHHALGSEEKITTHFLNWLAVIVQHRTRTRTAWVLHGVSGTGKGVLFNEILRPIFGEASVMKRMEELDEKFNNYLQDALMVMVDEVQMKALKNERSVMANLKNFITEPVVAVRAMYAGSKNVPNFSNWLFSSNQSDPVLIEHGDRRFNVGKYQSQKISIAQADITRIKLELQAFYNHLADMPCSVELAGQIIESADRNTMISLSEASVDTVSHAITTGNFEFFIDQLPTDQSHVRNPLLNNKVEDYREVLRNLILRATSGNMPTLGQCNIAREELRTLFDYTVGNMPITPNKFTSLMKHHRMHMQPVWNGTQTVRGISTTWKDPEKLQTYLTTALATAHTRAPSSFTQPPSHLTRIK